VLIRHKDSKHTFSFDRVFLPDCSQEDVYEHVAKPVVQVLPMLSSVQRLCNVVPSFVFLACVMLT